MKFETTYVSDSGARLGVISNISRLPDCEIETPTLMLYTQGGSVPHLTAETLSFVTTDPHLLRVPFGTVLNYVEPLKDRPTDLSTFVGLRKHVSCLTVDDPLDKTETSGKHRNCTVAVWSRSGKAEFSAAEYADSVASLSPDLYFCLSDTDTETSSPKKRVSKSVTRTIAFAERSVKLGKKDPFDRIGAFATISGGFVASERDRCIDSIVSLDDSHFAGYSLDGFGRNEKPTGAVKEIVPRLPPAKLRVVLNRYDPLSILELVESGVDVFDSAYVFEAVDEFRAFTFTLSGKQSGNVTIDLKDVKYRGSFAPLLDGCECLACRNHTKAYIYHLVNVGELLGSVLIAVHNLYRFVELFKAIRSSIRNGTLGELREHLSGQYGRESEVISTM